jgi:hypothetical protein
MSRPITLTIKDCVRLARLASYNETNKEQFRFAALKYLRRLAKELGLVKGTYSIRFNPGGIAVSGDATLHHDLFYLTIGQMGALWRTCKGQRDYTGGPNQWIGGFGNDLNERDLRERLARILLTDGVAPLKSTDRNELLRREADIRGSAYLMAD